MRTDFTPAQLADPTLKRADEILRACVHCGFCTAVCPTYLLLGDEADSPRGRIYLIKDMLESGRAPEAEEIRHLDRCLTCLSCTTTCPSGVDYARLVDIARHKVEESAARPPAERRLRAGLAALLTRPAPFRLALKLAAAVRPLLRSLEPVLPPRLAGMLALVPAAVADAADVDRPQTFPAQGARRMRVALSSGCAQQALAPNINAATVRLLTRLGMEVVVADGAGCCGALPQHMGMEGSAKAKAAANVRAWGRELRTGGLDAVIFTASGCGLTVKDYGRLLADDVELAETAARIAALACDVTEIVARVGLGAAAAPRPLKIAYHAACSMQHGLKLKDPPRDLLKQAGFTVSEIAEGHICCGSAGTYNLLQPDLAGRLGERKAANIAATGADAAAAGNIGCLTQIALHAAIPTVHTVELLDWATGGPVPPALNGENAPLPP